MMKRGLSLQPLNRKDTSFEVVQMFFKWLVKSRLKIKIENNLINIWKFKNDIYLCSR